jgi:ethanolamine utilization protein EutN
MLFGRVVGTAVCTMKYQGTEGLKLLLIQPLNKKLEPTGPLQVAADVVQAGPGDLCVLVRSREASLALPDVKFVPIDLAIIGIVDEVTICPNNAFDYVLKKGLNRFA